MTALAFLSQSQVTLGREVLTVKANAAAFFWLHVKSPKANRVTYWTISPHTNKSSSTLSHSAKCAQLFVVNSSLAQFGILLT